MKIKIQNKNMFKAEDKDYVYFVDLTNQNQ